MLQLVHVQAGALPKALLAHTADVIPATGVSRPMLLQHFLAAKRATALVALERLQLQVDAGDVPLQQVAGLERSAARVALVLLVLVGGGVGSRAAGRAVIGQLRFGCERTNAVRIGASEGSGWQEVEMELRP